MSVSNGSCFGVAWNDDPVDDAYYTNDWAAGNLFFTDDFGTSWSTSPNPAGTLGRGMAFDGNDYWQTDRDGGSVWRFTPGVGEEEISVPQVSGTLSGVAVYPEGSNLGVIVAGYNDPSLLRVGRFIHDLPGKRCMPGRQPGILLWNRLLRS